MVAGNNKNPLEVYMAKKEAKKGKKAHKNKPTSKKYSHYKIEGRKIVKYYIAPDAVLACS